MSFLRAPGVPSAFPPPYHLTYTIVMACLTACLPKIFQAIMFITRTPLPGTEEMTNHVYEMNKQINEEQSTSFAEQLILPCLN